MTRENMCNSMTLQDAIQVLKDTNSYGTMDIAKSVIIKALEQEPCPKTERCRWIRYDYRTICPQSHDIDNPYWRISEKRMDVLKYCPYCGKEIEVTE